MARAKATRATKKTVRASRASQNQTGPSRSSKSQAGQGPNGPQPPYGDPIRDAIEKGELSQMRRVATQARAWLKDTEKRVTDVRGALATLEQAIKDLGR